MDFEAGLSEFEAFQALTSMLKKHLSGSQIRRILSFCEHYKEHHTNLFEAIHIILLANTSSITAKINMFYVIDGLVKLGAKTAFDGYSKLVESQLKEIICGVVDYSRDDTGKTTTNPNANSVKKVLKLWASRDLVDRHLVETLLIFLDQCSPGVFDVSSETITRIMEDDRDRSKRAREDWWTVSKTNPDVDMEFSTAFENAVPVNELDIELMQKYRLQFDEQEISR